MKQCFYKISLKLFLLGFLFFQTHKAVSQDVSVINMTAPVSGCALTATEQVVIRIFNYGPSDLSGVNIPVSYTLNGGPAVNETAVFPSFLANSTATYTFTTTANLSSANTYTFTASTSLVGDVNPTNNSFLNYTVTSTAVSVGGAVSGGTSVCISGNSGVLTLSGQTGSILNWESSTDGGNTWINISNTTTSQSYSNVTVPTRFRALVQNGLCTAASSSPAILTIDPTSVGGSISPATATLCSGSSGTLTLSGKTGIVQYWEFSTNGGVSWTNIPNTGTTQTYTVTTTTRYRANVKSGSCSATNSAVSVLTVNPTTIGGDLSPVTQTVCSAANSGTISLTNNIGTVQRWEQSTNAGVSWTNITNTTSNQNFLNLTSNTLYRALVKSGVCPTSYSDTATVLVTAASAGGTISSNATVCNVSNSGNLTLGSEVGTVLNWQTSIDGGTTWTVLANTTNTQTYTNLIQATLFRASVQNASCNPAFSSTVTISVDDTSKGGSLSQDAIVCASSNNGTITLSGQNGSVQNWESSSNQGLTWSNIANTTSSLTYSNLTDTTYYRVGVKNGVCPVEYSDTVIITVDPVTVGGSVSASASVCSGSNNDTLFLTGYTGSVQNWEYTLDGGSTWINLVNTNDFQAYSNLSSNTVYRALVKSGVCQSAYSGTAALTVDPQTVGGTTYGATTICQNSNSGAVTLIGHVANIDFWESSTDGGNTWSPIPVTSTILNYSNLSQTTEFRAIISSGVCPNDTSASTLIQVDGSSIGGVVSTTDTVCAGNNSGTLNLSGETGSVLNWEMSTDNGLSWITLSNTGLSQSYANLVNSTLYRTKVKNGVCPFDYSDSVLIKVDPLVSAGIINSSATVCISNANGTLTATGISGQIIDWEMSQNNGVSWSSLGNTAPTFNYASLTDTSDFRVIVSGGVCGNDTSAITTITVTDLSQSGVLIQNDTLCISSSNDTLHLSGYTGTILGWEFSTNAGSTWSPITNSNDSLFTGSLNGTTTYRVKVQNGVCPVVYSNAVELVINNLSVSGSISSSATHCISNANGTLSLSGNSGTVTDWESSLDNGQTWMSLATASSSYSYSSLTDTSFFRALVKNGKCPTDTSAYVSIIVDTLTNPGILLQTDTFCISSAYDTLILNSNNGSIIGWEYSLNNGALWSGLTLTDDSLITGLLTSTTVYRAKVKNGVCPAAYSNQVKLQIDPLSESGFISGGSTACALSNSGTLQLNNSTGIVSDWIYSLDNGQTWQSSGVSGSTYQYLNITDTTYFKTIVESGKCPADTSLSQIVFVYPLPLMSFVADTVCFGTKTNFINNSSVSSGFISNFTWQTGDGNNFNSSDLLYEYSSADTFQVNLIGTTNFGCKDTVSSDVIVKPSPVASIIHSLPLSFCPGDSTVLSFVSEPNLDFSWNNLSTDSTLTIDTTELVVLIISDSLTGCSAVDSVQVKVFDLETVSAGDDISTSVGTEVQLQGIGNGLASWQPDEFLSYALVFNPYATVSSNTTFTLTVTDDNGCIQRDSMRVMVSADLAFDVKDLITPNGDGMNDFWYITNIENHPDNEVTVFNREGNIVYQKKGYANEWQGTRNGKILPDGSYFYIIRFDDSDVILKGNINILSNK